MEFELNGEKCVGMTCLMTNDTRQINQPSSYYMHTIWECYLENGMDKSYLLEPQSRALDVSAQCELESRKDMYQLEERELLIMLSEKLQSVTERQTTADSIMDNRFCLICIWIMIITSPHMIRFILQGYYITQLFVYSDFFWDS